MNNPMNKLFTNVANFTETPSVITNAADKLLSYVLPKDDAAAGWSDFFSARGSTAMAVDITEGI